MDILTGIEYGTAICEVLNVPVENVIKVEVVAEAQDKPAKAIITFVLPQDAMPKKRG